MMEKFEYRGVWWLPDRPEKRVSGTLKFTPEEGAILDLIGSFKDVKNMDERLQPEIIWGISSDGENITLYKCFETKSRLSIPGFQTSSFYATFVFIGAHFQKPEDIKFKSLSVHYSHLDEWVNISGFDILWDFDKDEILIKYRRPEPIQTNIGDGLKILIVFKSIWPSKSIVQKEATIKQKTEIKMETSEDKPFEYYRKIMYHIQNFLSLGIMEPVYPLTIEGTTEVNKKTINDEPYYPPVKIFYKLSDVPKTPKTLLPFDMLFTFKDISDKFEVFLKNWFEKADLLEPVYNLYFGTLYNPRMYLEHRFLSLIQAIESFHQRTCGGKYLSDEDYKVVYDALVAAIPDRVGSDLKDRLKGYLKYGNEFSLIKRLKDIFRKYPIVDRFIKNKDTLIKKVVDTRNYYTHYNKTLKENAATGEELYRLTQKLKMLVEVCLLTELGFSSEEIGDLFSRNMEYQHEFIQ